MTIPAISTKSIDVVGVYTQDFKQLFPRANVMKASVKEESKLMEHPLENGSLVTDHRIILQTEIELPLILKAEDYKDTYANIRQVFLAGTVLLVQTNATVYTNQIIWAMPHEEDPDRFNTLLITLTLKQIQIVTPAETVVPKNPTNNQTVNRGTVIATPASAQKTQKSSALIELMGLKKAA